MAREGPFWAPMSSFPKAATKTVQQRRAEKAAVALRKQGKVLSPVRVTGRKMATTFWGNAWCTNLESYSDYANRLPRGRTYVRTGAVLDLVIDTGRVTALVQGRDRYDVTIKIAPVEETTWRSVIQVAGQQVGSLMDLLAGDLPDVVIQAITRPQEGLFPHPREIALSCSCPDWATMCKHVAAVMYGIGARLDSDPRLLFKLRRVDASQLVAGTVAEAVRATSLPSQRRFTGDLASVFGIELETSPAEAPAAPRPKAPAQAQAAPKPIATPKRAAPKPAPPRAAIAPPRPAPPPITWTRVELGWLGVTRAQVDRWLREGLLKRGKKRGELIETAAFRPLIEEIAARS